MSVQAAGRAALIRGVRGSKKARRMGYQGTPGGQVLRKVAGVRPAHLLYRKSGRKSRLLIGHSATEAAESRGPVYNSAPYAGGRYGTGREVPVSRTRKLTHAHTVYSPPQPLHALVLTPSAYEVVEGWTIECLSLMGCAVVAVMETT